MTTVEELQERVIDKQQEIERLEALYERRKHDLETEAQTIQDLEIMMGTSNVPSLRELGREVAPEDFLDMVNRLENKLKLQQMRSAVILKEVNEARLMNKHVEDQIHALDDEATKIKAITGYKGPDYSNSNAHICSKLAPPEQHLLIQELRILIAKIKEELRATKVILDQKTKVIMEFSMREQQLGEMQEKVFELRNELNVQNNELEKINNEHEEFRKHHLKADKAISRLENVSGSGCLSSLMQDKLFLKAKIYEHVDMRRTQDKAIKAQSFRLAHLQKRADVITNAVADLKMTEIVSLKLKGSVAPIEEPVCSLDIETILPSDETIDVALYELLCRDVEAINNSIGLKDIILLEKEATIEALEEKVERVLYTNEEDFIAKNSDVLSLQRDAERLHREVWNDRAAYQAEIAELRLEKAKAQKKVAQARKSLRKSQGSSR
eukprot:TRINITY_DN17040_c0_g1_i1.p1 TRINITY_DN17040_c0_g1~~TRINITY_DN17040_c0_g1_i1.p1  ORF type:complete len:456 (+),score=198.48 TRINITY_DN17040_c0_g1_i1:52-1368(+)